MSFGKAYKKQKKAGGFPLVQIDTTSYHTLSEQIESLLKPGIGTLLAQESVQLEYDSEVGDDTDLDNLEMDPTNNIAFDKLDAMETAEKLDNKLSDSANALAKAQNVSEARAKESNAQGATETSPEVS